jgi:predicted ATPase
MWLLLTSMPGLELKRVWVRNFKSLRDFSLDVKSRLIAVAGPSGSGKTSLIEVFELWRDLAEHIRDNAPNPFLKWWGYENAVWRGDWSLPIALGLELSVSGVRIKYELQVSAGYGRRYGRPAVDETVAVETGDARLEYSGGVLKPGGVALRRNLLSAICAGEPISVRTDDARLLLGAVSEVCRFISNIAVLKELNWAELRRPKRLEKQTRLLPDASNLAPMLLQLTGGRPSTQVEETLRRLGYSSVVFPVAEDGRIYIKLTRADGAAVAQPAVPAGALKALAVETALMLQPTLVAVDNFECNLDEDLQLYLLEKLANSGAYVFVATTSKRVLEHAEKAGALVELRLEGGETKAKTQQL